MSWRNQWETIDRKKWNKSVGRMAKSRIKLQPPPTMTKVTIALGETEQMKHVGRNEQFSFRMNVALLHITMLTCLLSVAVSRQYLSHCMQQRQWRRYFRPPPRRLPPTAKCSFGWPPPAPPAHLSLSASWGNTGDTSTSNVSPSYFIVRPYSNSC